MVTDTPGRSGAGFVVWQAESAKRSKAEVNEQVLFTALIRPTLHIGAQLALPGQGQHKKGGD
jgi:thiamine monophosphate kinase